MIDHGEAWVGSNRRAAAMAAQPSASTASVTDVARVVIGPWSGSGSWDAMTPLSRSEVACSQNLRSQFLTVDSGLPRSAAIVRCPLPLAAMSRAAPIDSDESRRLGNDQAGRSTWVLRQAVPTSRHGRSEMPDPSSRRIWRTRAYPHGCIRPPQCQRCSPRAIPSIALASSSTRIMSLSFHG